MTIATRQHPIERRVQWHRQQAERVFAEHVVEVRLDQGLFRNWRCSRPNSGTYAFNVSTEPGRIFVTGDLGILIVERTEDMIGFCRSSIDSIEYFAEKVPQEIPTREYDDEIAEAWVKEQLEEEDLDREVRKALEDIEDFSNKQHFYDYIYGCGAVDGGDFPNVTNYKSGFLWCREAIRFLLQKI